MFKKKGIITVIFGFVSFISLDIITSYTSLDPLTRVIVIYAVCIICIMIGKRVEYNMLGHGTSEDAPSDNTDLLDDKAPRD